MIELNKSPFNLMEPQIHSIKTLIDNMSIEAKIGQLFFVIGQDDEVTDLDAFIRKYQPGGMMYRPDKADKIKRQIAKIQHVSDIPLFMAANLESGGNGIVSEGTWVGNPLQIAATDDTELAFQLGRVAGEQANQVGVNMAFAPIIDLDLNFRNPITNTRTYGSDVNRVQQMAKAQINGFCSEQVYPVIKHFPGDGVDERDQHLVSSVNSLSADEWMASYGKLYSHFIEKGVGCIMVGHIYQPAWERQLAPELSTEELRPASVSKVLINGLLRDKLGFQGLAITDATAMLGYTTIMPRKQLLVETINAGIDMILFNKSIDEDYQAIRDALSQGTLTQTRLDEAVTRIVATKMAQGLFGDKSLQFNDDAVIMPHPDVPRKIAQKSITLVKDRDCLLPITPQKYPRIRLVVLGDSDDGGFKEGGQVGPLFVEALEKAGFQVTCLQPNQLDFHEIFEEGVADLKAKFDLALYVANIETASNQTTTRLQWIPLMTANAPWFEKEISTVFVSTANPYHLFDVPYMSTFINAYTGNPETVQATVRKMIGQEDFTGINPVDPFCGYGDLLLQHGKKREEEGF